MGLSILSEMAIQADHRVLTAKDGFAPIDRTEVALVAAPDASPATLRLADRLAEFCEHGAGEGGVEPSAHASRMRRSASADDARIRELHPSRCVDRIAYASLTLAAG